MLRDRLCRLFFDATMGLSIVEENDDVGDDDNDHEDDDDDVLGRTRACSRAHPSMLIFMIF